MSSWENCSHLLRIGHGHARCGVPATHFYRFKNPRTASKTIMYAKPPSSLRNRHHRWTVRGS